MTLQKQLVPLSFGGGLDTKTDPSSVPLGKWLTLENCTFAKPKSLHKRNGYTSLAQRFPVGALMSLYPLATSNAPKTGTLTGPYITAGSALAARGNELLLGTGTSLYSYDPGDDEFVSKGALPTVGIT